LAQLHRTLTGTVGLCHRVHSFKRVHRSSPSCRLPTEGRRRLARLRPAPLAPRIERPCHCCCQKHLPRWFDHCCRPSQLCAARHSTGPRPKRCLCSSHMVMVVYRHNVDVRASPCSFSASSLASPCHNLAITAATSTYQTPGHCCHPLVRAQHGHRHWSRASPKVVCASDFELIVHASLRLKE